MVIIVLGCYRSGTSAIAGILHHLGVFMGEKFDNPTHANPKGYFEDIEFKRLFKMWTEGKEVEGLVDNLIKQRDLVHPLWGIKDPQMCLFFDKFVHMTKNSKTIVVHRPKKEICESLAKSIGYSDSNTYKPLVDYYLSKMEEKLIGYEGEILHIDFKKLLSENEEIEKICSFVDKPISDQVVNFIKN